MDLTVVALALLVLLTLAAVFSWQVKNNQQRMAVYYCDYVKYVVLALACCLMVGSSGGYDSPSTLNRLLQEWLDVPFATFQYQFNVLYSAYALPNVFLPIFAGSAIERLGFAATLLTLTSFVFAGVLLYAIGVTSKIFFWMVCGRVLLGIGSESLTIAQSSLVTKYFLSADLSFALAITMSMSRLTSVMNYTVMPMVAAVYGVAAATWMAVGMCVFSLAAAIAAVTLNNYNARREKNRASTASTVAVTESRLAAEDDNDETVNLDEVRLHMQLSSSNVVAPNINNNQLLRRSNSDQQLREDTNGVTVPPASHSQASTPRSGMKKTSSNADINAPSPTKTGAFNLEKYPRIVRWAMKALPVHCADFPRTFWLTTSTLICYSTATITFIPMAPSFLEQKYFPGDYVSASSYVSIPDTFSVIMLPLAGMVADRLSKRGKGKKSTTAAVPPSYAQVPTSPSSDEHQSFLPRSTADLPQFAVSSSADSLATVSSTSMSVNERYLLSQQTKSLQVLFSGVFIFMAHLMFTFTEWHPLVPLLTLGVGYSGYGSVMYSLMAEIVAPPTAVTPPTTSSSNTKASQASNSSGEEDGRVASAYGVSGCMVNTIFFITPLIVAFLLAADSTATESAATTKNDEADDEEIRGDAAGYFRMECFFSLVSLCGVMTAYSVNKLVRREIAALRLRNGTF